MLPRGQTPPGFSKVHYRGLAKNTAAGTRHLHLANTAVAAGVCCLTDGHDAEAGFTIAPGAIFGE
jgi:hypothetical protein